MTAPALPRDDQAVEQAFDVELESLMDGDVRCLWPDCGSLATHVLVHGTPCSFPMCKAHTGRWLAQSAGRAPDLPCRCRTCDAKPVPLRDFITRPI